MHYSCALYIYSHMIVDRGWDRRLCWHYPFLFIDSITCSLAKLFGFIILLYLRGKTSESNQENNTLNHRDISTNEW